MSAKNLWITNISNRDIALHDLNLIIPSKKSINLYDFKHSRLTEEQINASMSSGSIFKKKSNLFINDKLPKSARPIKKVNELPLIGARKNDIIIEKTNFDELNINEEEYAAENADLAEADRNR